MGIYKVGMNVRILVGALKGQFAKVVDVRADGIGVSSDQWPAHLSYMYDEIEPAIMVELAPLDTQPPSADAPRGDGIDAGGVVSVTSDQGITSRAVWVKIDGNEHLFVEASAVHEHIDAGGDSGYSKGYRAGVVDGYTGVNASAVEILETELAAAREALRACINADVTGFWSPEEVAKRFFAAYPGSE